MHLDEYIQLLASEGPLERCAAGLTWCFPDRLAYEHHVALVGSDTPEGNGLLARLAQRGMPQPLAELGFVSTSDFWAPWCVALHDGEIASIAFSARLCPQGAETGVTTVPAFRGRGFAAAATAGWAALPSLQGRALFYGTDVTNQSSGRVAERLGLRFFGARLAIA